MSAEIDGVHTTLHNYADEYKR